MTAVLSARCPADLIAVIPALLGFRPHESLVAVTTRAPRGRIGFQLRIDLPEPAYVDLIAEQVVGHLLRQCPADVLLVAYSDRPSVADPLVAAVRARLIFHGVTLRDALRADGARYWSYLDPESGCDVDGTPYDEASNAILAEAVYQGLEILPDRDALVARYAKVRGAARRRMRAATRRATQAYEACCGSIDAGRDPGRDPLVLRAGLDQVMPLVDTFERAPERVLSDDEVATLAVWAGVVVVRDCLWAQITRANAASQLALWTHVAARVVEPYEPAVLSLTAFAGWLSGSGSVAQCALDRVAVADPDYSMAALIQTAVSAGLDPATWEGLDIADVMRSVPGLV